MTVADIILAENHRWFLLSDQNWLVNPDKGVTMHKIDGVTALSLEDLITTGTAGTWRSLPFSLACIDIEGIYDPDCINGNFLGSNKARLPEGFDVGVAQLKLRYVMASEKCSIDDARGFAFNPKKAIPYFFGIMAGHLVWADSVIAQQKVKPDSAFNSAYLNRYLLATCSYNEGDGGMEKLLTAPTISHGTHVMDMERKFASQLGVTSLFPLT